MSDRHDRDDNKGKESNERNQTSGKQDIAMNKDAASKGGAVIVLPPALPGQPTDRPFILQSFVWHPWKSYSRFFFEKDRDATVVGGGG